MISVVQINRTEVIQDNLNPVFTSSVNVDYHFEMIQKLQFKVMDEDNPTKDLLDGGGEMLGEASITLQKVSLNESGG